MGVLPGGATNVLVRALGLPTDPVECTGMLIPKALDDEAFKLNLGRADGRYFAVNCGAGIDAAAMLRLDPKFPPTQARYERAAFRAVASELLVGYAGRVPTWRCGSTAGAPSVVRDGGADRPVHVLQGLRPADDARGLARDRARRPGIRKLPRRRSRGSRGRCSAPRATSRDATSTTRTTPHGWWSPRGVPGAGRRRLARRARGSRSTSPSRRSGSWPRPRGPGRGSSRSSNPKAISDARTLRGVLLHIASGMRDGSRWRGASTYLICGVG